MSRTQVGGTHYEDMLVQPIDLIEQYKLSYHEGNVLKYVMRHESKNGKEDLEKALDYLRMLEDGRNTISTHWYDKWLYRNTNVAKSLPYDVQYIITYLLLGRGDKIAYSMLRTDINSIIFNLSTEE